MFQTNFDLVVSGINPGPNIGTGYSLFRDGDGDSAGLLPENTIDCGIFIPKTRDEKLDFDFAAEVTKKIAINMKTGKLKTDAILNVNVPNISREQIKGILITRVADTGYVKPARLQGDKRLIIL